MRSPRTTVTATREWIWLLIAAMVAMIAAVMIYEAAAGLPEPSKPQTVSIISPWAGMFCAGEFPGSPAYVEVGMHVEPSTVVGRIETAYAGSSPDSMVLTAGVAGTVTEVLVQDQQMVVPGQELFKVQAVEPVPTPK